jgi:tetratricopeptide (TPR) repeat protein
LVGYARFLFEIGDFESAEAKFQKAHAFERHNDANSDLLTNEWVQASYAEFLCQTSRASAALQLANTSTTSDVSSKQILRKPAESFLITKGLALIHLGQIERGLALYELRAKILKSAGLIKPFDTWKPEELVVPLQELGRLNEARRLLEDRNGATVESNAPADKDGSRYLRLRISLDLADGRVSEARAMLDKNRGMLAPPGIGALQTANLDWLEATTEQKEGRHEVALKRLESALTRIARSPDQLFLRNWQARLEELRSVSLVALGKPAEAQRSLEAAHQINKAIFDPKTSISVGRVALRLGGLHKAAGRTAVAKAYQAQADAIRRTHPLFEQWVL